MVGYDESTFYEAWKVRLYIPDTLQDKSVIECDTE